MMRYPPVELGQPIGVIGGQLGQIARRCTDRMALTGSITLRDVAARTNTLTVACSRCDRAGQYNIDSLIARHGRDFGVPALLNLLSADCPKRQSVTAYDRC